MKRIWIAAVTAALLLMSAVSAHAYSGKAFAKMPTRQAAGVYTQITDTEGKTHLVDGAVNAKTIENGDCRIFHLLWRGIANPCNA